MNKPFAAAIILIISYIISGFWPILGIITVACFILKRKEILVFAIYLSFFNMASAESAPIWGGLCGSLLAIAIYILKKPTDINLNGNKKYLYLSGFAFVSIVTISFFAIGKGSEFEKTAIKSSIQQVLFVFVFVALSGLSDKHKYYLNENLIKFMPKFLAIYTGMFFFVNIFFGEDLRFGGALGAQSLAFLLTLFLCYFSLVEKSIPKALMIFLCTVPTQSRTYLALQVVIVVTLFIVKEKRPVNKIIYSTLGVAVSILAFILMPFISKRLDYYDAEFFGTLFGRLGNYQNSIEMISVSPLLGNGVGSIVKVLEGWVVEFYEYYLASGDTTVMHNEYLRILTETGIIGLAAFIIFLVSILKGSNGSAAIFVFVFLVGSLLENTIALYSGPIVALAILVSSSIPLKSNSSSQCLKSQ